MEKSSKIYIAGHRGMVGSSILRALQSRGYTNFILKISSELDLRNQQAVVDFFAKEKPEYVFLAAAKVGGIIANNTYRADFIYENLMIQSNVIHQAYLNNVKKLLFLGSSCIYPKMAPQPLKEEYLLTDFLAKYSFSNATFASMEISSRPLICAQPVIPGFSLSTPAATRKAIKSSWLYKAGLGPTNTISPLMMLIRFGNSSKLNFRNTPPMLNK